MAIGPQAIRRIVRPVTRLSRRAALQRIAAPLTLGALAPWPAHAQKLPPLRVGFISIIPMAQLFVMEGRGWTKEAGLSLITKRFSSGPPMVDALEMGALDVAYVGIGPAMLARARGLDVKVVAANVVEQVALVARGPLAAPGEDAPGDRFRNFRVAARRPARIGTLPRGSVPDTVLRYFLEQVAKLSPGEVEIVGVGEDEVLRLLLEKSLDGASIVEPILSMALAHDPTARIIAKPRQMMPYHPGAVVLVTRDVIKNNPTAVERLVALHIRASAFARANPDVATNDIVEYLGRGLVDPTVIRRALTSEATQLIADPHAIVASTRLLQEYEQHLGSPAAQVDVDAMFDFSFFDAAIRR